MKPLGSMLEVSKVFNLLFENPKSFKKDPYGYLTNQVGHVYLGFTLVTYYSWVFDKLDSYPEQKLSVFVVLLAYLLIWELIKQGWQGWDTFEDTFYVFLGSSLYLLVEMEWVIDMVFTTLLFINFFLIVGTYIRYKRVVRG